MKARWVGLALVLGNVLFFAQTFDHGFYYDDRAQVLGGRLIRDWGSVPAIVAGPVWGNVDAARADESARLDSYRPLFNLSLLVDYQKGGLASWTFHSTNVILHALTAGALFATLVAAGSSVPAAGFVAALFSLHPLALTPVNYVSARGDSLAALCAWTALFFFARRRTWPRAAAVLVPLAYLGALLSKESAILLPLVGFAWMWGEGARARARLFVRWSSAWVAPLALYLPVRAWALGGGKMVEGGGHVARAIANVPAFFEHFLRQVLHPDLAYPLIRFDARPVSVAGYLAALGLAALSAASAFAASRTAYRRWLWAPVFSLATLLPPVVASVNTGLVGAYYFYLPLTGLAAAVVPLAERLRGTGSRNLRAACAVSGLCALAWVAWNRCEDFTDEVALYSAIVQTDAPAPDAFYNLGNAWMRRREWARAIDAYEAHGARFAPDERVANNLGLAELNSGHAREAAAAFRGALNRFPPRPKTHYNLGLALEGAGDPAGAAGAYAAALALDPAYPEARAARATLCARQPGACAKP